MHALHFNTVQVPSETQIWGDNAMEPVHSGLSSISPYFPREFEEPGEIGDLRRKAHQEEREIGRRIEDSESRPGSMYRIAPLVSDVPTIQRRLESINAFGERYTGDKKRISETVRDLFMAMQVAGIRRNYNCPRLLADLSLIAAKRHNGSLM